MLRLRSLLIALCALPCLASVPVSARDIVEASEPDKLAVTVYRDPTRGERQKMNRDNPRGFAMISETRTVTLPAGESTIRFTGVAEGMVAVTAIVTGLPGGTIEKNRNADLLSPAALVDGSLGNRVRITRSNPATGQSTSEDAIIRTRADGGIVLQTSQGYEAVRCAGLPEKLTFDSVPDGLSAQPVFTIDTRNDAGGTYTITLTYLAWGFDWEAHYVATLGDADRKGRVSLSLLSWLTLLNDNGQSFPDAELLAVAGTLNVESDFQQLSDPPRGEPIRLRCYPIGSTSNFPVPPPPPPPPPSAPMGFAEDQAIVVTGTRLQRKALESAAPLAVIAAEEQLGDLKLYRIPEPISVNAQGLKQVAFLNKEKVRGEMLYEARCEPYDEVFVYDDGYDRDDFEPANILLKTKNTETNGLGVALPAGGFTIFEPSSAGDLLVGEENIRDYAVGQDVEVALGQSTMVFSQCARVEDTPEPDDTPKNKWVEMRAVLTNAGSERATIRLDLGDSYEWEVRKTRGLGLKDGKHILTTSVKPGSEKVLKFRMRLADRGDDEG